MQEGFRFVTNLETRATGSITEEAGHASAGAAMYESGHNVIAAAAAKVVPRLTRPL